MNTFVSAAVNAKKTAKTRTTNGMKANVETGSGVLDLFSTIGSSRGKDITPIFAKSLGANEDLTLRTLLWARDIRGGAGERQTFRTLLGKLEEMNPILAGKIMHKVPEMGRWDDLFTYKDPINRRKAFNMIREALINKEDLVAKWLPREKTKNAAVAVELAKFMGLTAKEYRKLVVGLSNVVETQMCAKDWDSINFSHVPSLASARYQKAFGKNAPIQYSTYINELKKPEVERDPSVKINAGAVYPYNVIKSLRNGNPAVADAQWKALPNYVGDAKILPMVDVSGSMHTGSNPSAIDVALSLGLYLSDKCESAFKDMFLTFSTESKLELVKGTLSQKMLQMDRSKWTMSTNLHSAFNSILDLAVTNSVDPEDMPEMILILSDMQFDQCTRYDDSALQMIQRKYETAGYTVPKIIFWNLNIHANTPVSFDSRGTCMVSGFSTSILKSILSNNMEEYTPENVMLETLNNERYNY